MREGQAHFTVTGEFLTNISRQLWAEGRPEAGLRILEAAWMKVQKGDAWAVSVYAAGIKTIKATSRQEQKILDWYMERGKDLPYWMEPDEE